MKERPILFSTPMVQAILQGRKTQTRRVVKMPDSAYNPYYSLDNKEFFYYKDGWGGNKLKCPYGQVGDVLWVRETWAYTMVQDETKLGYVYKADEYIENEVKWKPSIHMPKEACRLKLRITNIRVERLQDISPKDVVKEGIEGSDGHWKNYLNGGEELYRTDSFRTLWQSINGEQSWDDNLWVWVIEFERLNTPNK